jgi:uncharacterized membrane protein
MLSKSDKPFALRVIIACLLAIILVYVLLATISHQVAGNFYNATYIAGVVVLFILFALSANWAYKAADGANDNLSKVVVIGLTVVIIAWACGWVAGSNEKVAPGSAQLEDIQKSESLYTDTNNLPAKIPN